MYINMRWTQILQTSAQIVHNSAQRSTDVRSIPPISDVLRPVLTVVLTFCTCPLFTSWADNVNATFITFCTNVFN